MNQNSFRSNLYFRPILRAHVKIIPHVLPNPHELDYLIIYTMHAGSLYINLTEVGNGRYDVRTWPAPHIARGRKTLQMHGFLYIHGKTLKGRNFNSKA